MAISPIPHWFEGSEYTHKVAACIMKYGPIRASRWHRSLAFRKARYRASPVI